MNPSILTQFGLPDPNASPLNFTEEVALLNSLITSELQGDYIPYIISANTPSVDDQDKAWIEKDTSGRPLAIKIFYNGNWRRIYNGMVGEVRLYSGDPSVDFDTTGLGNVGGRFDGWALMNGNNGTINLTDKFVIAAHLDNSDGHVGYSSGWQTFVDGVSDLQTGGSVNPTITEQNLPPLDIVINGFDAKEAIDHAPSVTVLVDTHYANDKPETKNVPPHYGAVGAQTPLPTIPPFLALAYITFVGYS